MQIVFADGVNSRLYNKMIQAQSLQKVWLEDETFWYWELIVSEVPIKQERVEGFGEKGEANNITRDNRYLGCCPARAFLAIDGTLSVHIHLTNADPSAVFAQGSEDYLGLYCRAPGRIRERRV